MLFALDFQGGTIIAKSQKSAKVLTTTKMFNKPEPNNTQDYLDSQSDIPVIK